MVDDYFVVPSMANDKTTSNPAKEAEKADSATCDNGQNSATETEVGSADLGPHHDGKNPAKTAKQIDGRGADSGVSKDGNNSTKTAKKQDIRSVDVLLFICLSIMLVIWVAMVIHGLEKAMASGPEFHVHSLSVSTFSISWWSGMITADWKVALGVKNLNSERKLSYDFMEVSVFHGVNHLSTTMAHSFRQVAGDELLLRVNFPPFPAKIDPGVADSIKEAKTLNNSLSVNVVIRAKISHDNHPRKSISESLIASCQNIELQFSSNGEEAKMIAEEPIKCEFSE